MLLVKNKHNLLLPHNNAAYLRWYKYFPINHIFSAVFYFVYFNLVMKYTLGKKLVDILWEQMLLKTLLMPKTDFRIKTVPHQIIESIFYLTFKRKSFFFVLFIINLKIFQFRNFFVRGITS